MRVEIFIVSYLKDLPYLELNLRSIEKFASGFSGTTVLVPKQEEEGFASLESRFNVKVFYYDRYYPKAQWHLGHQVEKCHADQWCDTAEMVLHTDSDCMFTEPVSPEDYLVDGKPVMLYESYSRLPRDIPWRAVVGSVLKHPVEYEFMRRHPQVNPVGIYPELRSKIEQLHGEDFSKFVLSRKADFPWGFTEHNVIGAYAWHSVKWHDQYHWHNVGKSGFPREKLIQFWSHTGIEVAQEIAHGGRYTPKEFAERILS